MAGSDVQTISASMIIAAGTADRKPCGPPPSPAGATWYLEQLTTDAAATLAANATNYTTINPEKTATLLTGVSLASDTTAFTVNTRRDFVLTTASRGEREFVEGTDVLVVEKVESGTGGALDIVIYAAWRKIKD